MEGWHRRINYRANNNSLGCHVLVHLLQKESAYVETQVTLVSEDFMKRYQRAKYAKLNTKIFDMWEDYTSNKITGMVLIKKVAKLNGHVDKST